MDDFRVRGAEFRKALADLSDQIWGIATSPKLHKAIVYTVVVLTCSVFSYYLAIPTYAAFYHFHLPDQIVAVPVHLQYGYGPNPFAVASLSHTSIKTSQAYDIEVELTLPHSPDNLERGNFMVGLLLLGDAEPPAATASRHKHYKAPPPKVAVGSGTSSSFIVAPLDIPAYIAERWVLYSATRPTRVPYRSGLVSWASSLLRLPYYALWPGTETNTVSVPMAEKLTFGRGSPVPSSLIVEVQAGQALQVYEATVTLKAQLRGIRYFMYQYRVTAFLIFTAVFWATGTVASLIFLVLPLKALVGKILGVNGVEDADSEGGEGQGKTVKGEGGELSDTERTFPSSSKHPALKFEGRVKQEEGVQAVSDIPPVNPGAEADDEDEDGEEDDGRARDSGIGTSFSDNRSREGTRRRTSGKGKDIAR